MSKAIIILLVISVGIGAYLKARREAMWSWPLLAKTVLWVLAIGGTMGIIGDWIGGLVGPEHALMTTMGVVAVIVAGVVVLTIWTGRKRGRG
jgi:predicted MFS family arabinose efflux permease